LVGFDELPLGGEKTLDDLLAHLLVSEVAACLELDWRFQELAAGDDTEQGHWSTQPLLATCYLVISAGLLKPSFLARSARNWCPDAPASGSSGRLREAWGVGEG